jgi:hypothetical protein
MPRIQDSGLRNLVSNLVNENRNDPSVKVDAGVLDQIVSLVGDRWFRSSDSVADTLSRGNLMPEEKLALAKKGLDSDEKADVQALLDDPDFSALLDPVSTNFLKALIGIEPLRAIDTVGGAGRVDAVGTVTASPEAKAVSKLKEVMKSGQLKAYYDAAIGIGDASLKTEALALFEALPTISTAATAQDFVDAGLWTTAPRGIEKMQNSARYLPGRQLICPAKVNTDTGDTANFLAWDDNGQDALTYRATLVGDSGDNFLIKIDGKDDPISVPKADIYARNQPHVMEGESITVNGKTANYADPLLKAKIAEAAIKMDELVGQLDFTKLETETTGGAIGALFSRGSTPKKRSEIQRKCVGIIHDVIDMKYRKPATTSEPGRDGGRDVGRLAVKGVGVCNEQAGVMAGLLAPFADQLGFDVAVMSGGVYRKVRSSDSAEKQFNTFKRPAHSWLQVTYRPTMEMRIIDRTWQQKDKTADKAYSKWGDRYPSSYGYGLQLAKPTATDTNFSGDVTTTTADRQFGDQGVDGRDNHMSSRTDHT